MRLIDADALRAQVEAAHYPMRSEMLTMIDAAKTVVPPANKWHDAGREQPGENGEYLVCTYGGKVEFAGYSNGNWYEEYENGGKWSECDQPMNCIVVYWMNGNREYRRGRYYYETD